MEQLVGLNFESCGSWIEAKGSDDERISRADMNVSMLAGWNRLMNRTREMLILWTHFHD